MDQETINQLKQQFQNLPQEIQNAILSVNLSEKLQEISKNNKLMFDKAGLLETETILVLYGIEPLENYTSNLIKNVGLTSIQASVIAHDVNESIFKSIRESLKKINDQILEEDKMIDDQNKENSQQKYTEDIPEKDALLSNIENPDNIKENENSVSLSSLKSNSTNPDNIEEIEKGIEVRSNNLPEIAPEAILPTKILKDKQIEVLHQNTSPLNNIVDSKLNENVIVPKQNITIEEKTKLPEKPVQKIDPYRESIQ